jgi:TetR/AcrR family transcriptional regulator
VKQVPAELAERLAAIAEPFAARGDELRVADVADATGIPRATLYYYFSGREDLLGFLLGHVVERRREAVEKALAEPGDERARLAGALVAVLQFIGSHPQAYTTLMSNLGVLGELRDLAVRSRATFNAPVEQLLREGVAHGLFSRVTNPETTATALFGAVTFAGLHEVMERGHVDVERVADELIPQLLAGLG